MALPKINTILYATSLGEHTRPVFRHAVNMADTFNAKIIMVHAVEPLGELGHALIQNYLPEELIEKMHDQGINEVKKQMEERVALFCEEELQSLDHQVELDVQHVVEEGNHTDAIMHATRTYNADMIVLGSENRFGFHSHTTQQVVKESKVPVLVVPTGKEFD